MKNSEAQAFRLKHPFRPNIRACLVDNDCGWVGIVEIMSFPYVEDGKVYVQARHVIGNPASCQRTECESLYLMHVKCERCQTMFWTNPEPKPSAEFQSTDYDSTGDLCINCPRCARGYYHYSNGKVLEEIGEKGKTGWHSDRPLTVIQNLNTDEWDEGNTTSEVLVDDQGRYVHVCQECGHSDRKKLRRPEGPPRGWQCPKCKSDESYMPQGQ